METLTVYVDECVKLSGNYIDGGDLFIDFIFYNLKPYRINKENFKEFEERLKIRYFTGSKAIPTYPIGYVSLDGRVLFRFMGDIRFNIEENKYVAAFYITDREKREDE